MAGKQRAPGRSRTSQHSPARSGSRGTPRGTWAPREPGRRRAHSRPCTPHAQANTTHRSPRIPEHSDTARCESVTEASVVTADIPGSSWVHGSPRGRAGADGAPVGLRGQQSPRSPAPPHGQRTHQYPIPTINTGTSPSPRVTPATHPLRSPGENHPQNSYP